MKIVLISVCAIILLSACNSGGNSSVPAYTTTTAERTTTAGNGARESGTAVLASTEAGRVLFQQRCASCHGLDGNARNNNAANLQFTRLDSLSITQTIKNGRGTMPPFKDAIADSDIAHLAIYVKSIRQ
jgi:mono/diheme cytochrome c family protein